MSGRGGAARAHPDQAIQLYTVAREAGLWYVVQAAPASPAGDCDPVSKQMIATVELAK